MNRPIDPKTDYLTQNDIIICVNAECNKRATIYNDTTDDMYCDEHAPDREDYQ